MVVVFLGLLFFALLALLLITTGKREGQARAPEAETLTVLAPRIRLRTSPDASAPVVATATAGQKLTMLEDRSVWVRVQDSDGLIGWAERGGLERTSERERRLVRFAAIRKLPPLTGISTKRTPLYAGPGIFYPVVGDLADQTNVKVFTRDHDFYAIDFRDEIAYADVDAIDITAAGVPQLDVRTTTPATQPPEPTASASPPQSSPESPFVPEPEPEPVPAAPSPAPDRSRVFAVVPAGGTQPEELQRVMPRYPPAARAAGVGGPVVIRGIVRRDGSIDDVQVLKDLPFGLGDAARDAVERWRFRPATYDGEPIDVYYTVTVNFRLR